MPWLTYKYDSEMHNKLRQRFNIQGVPFVYVLEPSSGFLISKKGRKDICDLGVACMKNWADEIGEVKENQKKLQEGFAIAEAYRLKKEEEARKKKEEEEKI